MSILSIIANAARVSSKGGVARQRGANLTLEA
jgi:hypothetical protein